MSSELDKILGENLIPFGKIYIHIPNLLKGYLALRNSNKKYIKHKPMIPISHELKQIFIDILYKNKFEQTAYDALDDKSKKIFDDACVYAKFMTHGVSRLMSYSIREKEELLKKYELLKGEIESGSDSKEIIKTMRNILLELRAKRYIPKHHYDILINDVVNCL